MDIDGYDGSQLAPLDNTQIDNSLTANVNQMFDITSVETNDNLNNMGNELEDNSSEQNFIEPTISDEKYIEKMDNEPKKEDKNNKSLLKYGTYFINFIIIWVILGIIAFITSIVCFGFSGSISEKVIGFILALLFGPFYFLYFYLNKNYCGKK
jgi:hypothetical protein